MLIHFFFNSSPLQTAHLEFLVLKLIEVISYLDNICTISSESSEHFSKTPCTPAFTVLLNSSLSQVKIALLSSIAIFNISSSWVCLIYKVSKPKIRNLRATLPSIASAKKVGLGLTNCLAPTLFAGKCSFTILQKIRPFSTLIAISRNIASRTAYFSSHKCCFLRNYVNQIWSNCNNI